MKYNVDYHNPVRREMIPTLGFSVEGWERRVRALNQKPPYPLDNYDKSPLQSAPPKKRAQKTKR